MDELEFGLKTKNLGNGHFLNGIFLNSRPYNKQNWMIAAHAVWNNTPQEVAIAKLFLLATYEI
jgi:hypothetical protein